MIETPDNFRISPENQIGDVYGTEFVFTTNLPNSFTSFSWDFGNGVYDYNKRTVTQTYQYPGIYLVSLSAWNDEGFLVVDQGEVNVDYVYRDLLLFSNVPAQFGTPGLPSLEPFNISVISAKIEEPLAVVLQALNTNSTPYYAVPEKWRMITPKWKFLDASTNEILEGPIPLKKIFLYKDSKIVGVSATASFYYVDDLASASEWNEACPLLLAATLSTENFSYPPESLIYPYYSYSNSEVARAVIAWQISDTIPTELKVTENYLNDVFHTKWANVPIPLMITCRFNPVLIDSFGNFEFQVSDVLSYPRTNELGGVNPVRIILSAVDTGELIDQNLYTVEVEGTSYHPASAPLYFQTTDALNSPTNGYIFTTITPLSPINSTVVAVVSTVAINQFADAVSFAFPDGFPIYPNIFVSHPQGATINKFNVVTYNDQCENVKYYKDLGILVEGKAESIPIPISSEFNLSNFTLSGAAAVYNLSVDPIKRRLYAADADQDKIYVFDTKTNEMLSSINLRDYLYDQHIVPAYISVDKFSNFWVSCWGNFRLLKFDSDLNFIQVAVPQVSVDLDTIKDGNYLIEPPIIETDMDSNIWTCFAHPFSSMLIKFDGQTSEELFRADQFSFSSVPVSLAIDVLNNCWVACYDSSKLELYSSEDGTLLDSVSAFVHPSYIAMDRSNNVWVTHGYNICSVYNTTTGVISSWKVSSVDEKITSINVEYSPNDLKLAIEENEVWGGLTVDVFNRVWLVDSENNKIIALNPKEPTTTYRFLPIFPKADTNFIIKPGDNFMTGIEDQKVRSAQAAGDWSGNRWYQKYTGAFNALGVRGQSTPFKVYDLENSFQIAKVNETFSMSNYFKTLALPESLRINDKLFDQFFAAVAGNGELLEEDPGQKIYERIANFVQTHGDFETAEIDQLLSLAEQLSIQARTYGKDFPVEIQRLLNLFSINKHFLRGQVNYDADVNNSIGNILMPTTEVRDGQYLFIKDKQYNQYQLIYVNALDDGRTTYPLAEIDIDGVRKPIMDNYYFFEFNQQSSGYKNNIIDWDSELTTVSYNLTSNEDWYGDEGLVETMFNNLLTRRLFFDN